MIDFPRLSNLPFAIISDILFGAGYSYICKTDYKITITAFSVWNIAIIILFAIVNPLIGGDGKKRSLIALTATSALVNVTAILALRHFKIIGTIGTAFYSITSVFLLLPKVFVICFADLNENN